VNQPVGWRDELLEVAKSKSEREAEEAERRRKRIEEALRAAEEAMELARDGLRFAVEQLGAKKVAVKLADAKDKHRLELGELSVVVELERSEAVMKVTYNDGRPKDFDFAKDRHLAPKDVEEFVGRRLVELVRAAQKSKPW